MKQYIRDIITDYIQENPDTNNTNLADKILEDQAITGKSHRTIRGFIGDVRAELEFAKDLQENTDGLDTMEESLPNQSPEERSPEFNRALELATSESDEELEDEFFNSILAQEIPEEEEEEQEEEESDIPDIVRSVYFLLLSEEVKTDMYEVKNLEYKITMSKVDYVFDVELIDKVFCAYSRKGLNLTKTQIMSNLKLSVNELSAIMNKLNLTKDSEPFGPFTDEYMEQEDIYAVTVANATSLLDVVKETDSAALEAVIKAYKKAYVEYSNKNLRHDAFMAEIAAGIKALNITLPSRPAVAMKEDDPEYVNVVITDLHLGLSLPVFNYTIAEQKLNQIARDINNARGKKVIVSFLGDTIHTVTGTNHAGMWKTIEQGAWGANSIIKPFEILYKFLGSINNLVEVTSVSGNHDRLQPDKELEDSNEGSKLLFYMLANSMPQIKVTHTSHRTVFSNGNLQFINLHGDQGLDKKSADKIVWKYGKQDMFNLILEGHWHSRIITKEDDCANYRKMHCPAFAPTDDYADRLGLGSASGWLLITERDGLPMITDIPINYARTV